MNQYIRIGEVSSMYNISIDTLRHYDHIGLLKPYVNPANNYRYYNYQHLDILEMILLLKDTGMSLGLIETIIQSEDLNVYQIHLEHQQRLLKSEMKRLQKTHQTLKSNLQYIKHMVNYSKSFDLDSLELVNNPHIHFESFDSLKSTNIKLYNMKQIINYTVSHSTDFKESDVCFIINDKPLKGTYYNTTLLGTQKDIIETLHKIFNHFNYEYTESYIVYNFALLQKTLDHKYYVDFYVKKNN